MIQVFGQITPPPAIQKYGGLVGNPGGLIKFLNNLIRLLIVIGGLWAFINLILAGYGFLEAQGDPKKIETSWQKIWQSMLGLLIILGSFVLAAIFSYLLFGDPRAILNPKVYGP